MADEKVLRALLRFGVDKGSIDDVRKGTKSIEDALKDTEKQAEKTLTEMNRLRETSERFTSISMAVTAMGAALAGPVVLAARQYVQEAGTAESTSRRWLAATERIEDTQTRIGRVAAESVLPLLEKAADVAETAADFIEAHPGVIQAALSTGTAVAALGALGIAVSKGIRLYADVRAIQAGVQNMMAGRLMQDAANKNLAAANAMMAGGTGRAAAGSMATSVGLVVGGLIATGVLVRVTNEILEATGMSAYIRDAQNRIREQDPRIYPGIPGLGEAQSGADIDLGDKSSKTIGRPVITEQLLDAYVAYQEGLEELEEQYGESRTRIVEQYGELREQTEETYEARRTQIVRDFAQQQAEALEDFQRSQARSMRNFVQSESRYEQQYYEQRAQRARDFGIEIARMEQDHQIQMRQMREDSEARQYDLIGARDALGLARERRDYEVERQREEEAYAIQAGRRNADFALQMADMEANFIAQRAQRLADFEQRRMDEEADFNYRRQRERQHHLETLMQMDQEHIEEMARLQEQEEEQLELLDDQLAKEQAKRRLAWNKQLWDLAGFLGSEGQIRRAYMQVMLTELENYMKAMAATVPSTTSHWRGGRAAGGYAGFGQYTLGEMGNEFVLNAATTKAAERMANAQLSQERVLALMAGGRGGIGGSGRVTVQQNFTFHGGFSAAEKEWFREQARDQAVQAITAVVGAA